MSVEDDEALARVLQEEYEREYRRRSMQQHLRPSSQQQQQNQNRSGRNVNDVYRTNNSNSSSDNNNNRSAVPRNTTLPSAPVETDSIRASTTAYQSRGGISSPNRNQQRPARNITVPVNGDRSSHHNRTTRTPYHSSPSRNVDTATDEAIARRLERQIRGLDDADARRANVNSNNNNNNNRVSSSRPPTTTTQIDARAYNAATMRSNDTNLSSPRVIQGSSIRYLDMNGNGPTSPRLLNDEEVARRLAQMEHDAALARSLQISEQHQQNTMTVRAKKSFICACCESLGRLCSCLITLVMVVVAISLLWYYFQGTDPYVPGFIDPDNYREENPFNGTSPEDANRWRNKGYGLDLTLINALNTHWYDFFNAAVTDWDNGTPDSLRLSVMIQEPDSLCRPEPGYIKVCDGNYGETNWRGINKVQFDRIEIYASAARMNEYYFAGTDEFQRQYTMCHEIGHGFGLPHTDENFYNADLFNCMDYTQKPENNLKPSIVNYEFLAALYGTADGPYTPPTVQETQTNVVEANEVVPQQDNLMGGGDYQEPSDLTDVYDDYVTTVFDDELEEKPKKEEKEKKKEEEYDGRRQLNSMMLRSSSSSTTRPDGAVDVDDADVIQAKRRRAIELSEKYDALIDQGQFRDGQHGIRKLSATDSSSSRHVEEYEVDLGDGYRVVYHLLLVVDDNDEKI